MRVTKGWIGLIEGEPHFYKLSDAYCDGAESVLQCDMYKTESAVKKRFQSYAQVEIRAVKPKPKRKRKEKRK